MTLHVYEETVYLPGRDGVWRDVLEANVWCSEVPEDFTDADVLWNVQQWADAGDKVAKRALELEKSWVHLNAWGGAHGVQATGIRVYRDGPP